MDRCSHCRNRIKPHHATAGPAGAETSFHEDCWSTARAQSLLTCEERQRDYQRRIASDGLSALLSPYVSVFPQQRVGEQTTPVEASTDDLEVEVESSISR